MRLETTNPGEAIQRAKSVLAAPSLWVVPQDTDKFQAIERYLAHKLDHKVHSPETSDNECRILTSILRKFADTDLRRINGEKVAEWKRKSGHPPSTLTSYFQSLAAFFSWCVEQRIIVSSPLNGVPRPKAPSRGREKWVRAAQVGKLIAAASKSGDVQLEYILRAGFQAGLRKDEIIESKRDWFDLDAAVQTVRIPPGKTPHERTIPLTTDFAAFVAKNYGDREPDSYIIQPQIPSKEGVRTKKGHPKRYRYDFKRPFSQFLNGQNAAWITCHTMRHSVASILRTNGVEISVVAGYLGDSLATTIKHYAKIDVSKANVSALAF